MDAVARSLSETVDGHTTPVARPETPSGPARFARRVDTYGPWIALALLGVVFGLGVRSTVVVVENTAWVDHTHRVIESIDAVAINIARAALARRGAARGDDPADITGYAQTVRQMTAAVRRVRALTVDNLSQQRRLDALEPRLAASVARWDAVISYHRDHGVAPDHEAAQIRDEADADGDLAARTVDLAAEEQRLLVARERRMKESLAQTTLLEIVGACVGVLLITVVIVRLRREVRRRERSERTVREREGAITLLNADLARSVEARTAQLQRSNAELESFSYAVVHDLRAPLRAMGGFAEVLLSERGDALGPDAQDGLREILQNAQKLARLIDALVAMSRIPRTELKRGDVDFTRLVDAAGARFSASGSPPPRVLVVEAGLRCDADPSLARQLVEILLGNAWKFTGGGASARIEVGGIAIDGERVLFVRDDGAGFDMTHADKLFTPFGRLHTAEEFAGIGVGLATAQRIVERHGGRIWAEGDVGRGATFFFTLGPGGAGRDPISPRAAAPMTA